VKVTQFLTYRHDDVQYFISSSHTPCPVMGETVNLTPVQPV